MYYEKAKPGQYQTREAARKQFIQDRNIDLDIFKSVIDRVHREQLDNIEDARMLKALGAAANKKSG
jgi:hypothetical protein